MQNRKPNCKFAGSQNWNRTYQWQAKRNKHRKRKMSVNKMSGLCLSAAALIILTGCYGLQQDITSRDIQFLTQDAGVVKVMTFNIRVDSIIDVWKSWEFRKQSVFDILADNKADVIGVQEALNYQALEIQLAMPQYAYYAVGRNDGILDGESCAIFYRKDRFELLDRGTFWFSDTPAVPGTKDWGNLPPRICSWVYLREKGKNTKFYVYNLHLDAFSQNSRQKSVRLLAQQVAARKTNDPFIVMGDFNMALHNPAMMYLLKFGYDTPYPKMVDAWLSVHPYKSETSTRQSFGGRLLGPKIDHIPISENIRALEVKIDDREVNGRYPSDHFPVVAKILLKDST
jgi:endonuclease/exonuclease/phosphatase family metal-dependent hydrolase